MLVRFADPAAQGRWVSFGTRPITERDTTIPGASESAIKARIYSPLPDDGADRAASSPGVVVVHGVHRLGIDEPRLGRFSRSLAATGLTVFTPEVRELADYRVDPASIETIGEAAKALKRELGVERVGLMGMSFAGGLALLTAADPRYADDIGVVLAVGAHHDLARVSRFFATNRAPRPDGSIDDRKAHDYGPLVLAYGHIDGFFPKEDAEAAREALKLFLWEQHDKAREVAKGLRPPARARMEALLDRKVEVIAPELEAQVDARQAEMAAVSPSGRLAGIKGRVFLLHGAGDNVIPPSETLWLAKEVPAGSLEGALVSPAIGHVELDGEPPLSERLALVHFMTRVLDAAADETEAAPR